MSRIIRSFLSDILRNRVVLAYLLVLTLTAWSVFTLEDSSAKGVLTLLNISLLVIPLFAILFSTIYVYNSREFINMLVCQPLRRSQIWISLYASLGISLVAAYLLAVAVPVLLFVETRLAITLLATGSLITLVFASLAFLASVLSRDRSKGTGVAILSWIYFSLLYDGLLLFLMFQLADYPIENLLVVLAALNPLDLARILTLMQVESSAMLGATGAIFKQSFGAHYGVMISFGLMLLWSLGPFLLSLRRFNRMDL